MTEPPRERRGVHPFFQTMREQIIDTPMPAHRRPRINGPRLRPRSIRRRLPIAGGGIALAAALTALLITLGTGGGAPSPAYGYTVNVNANHTVTIILRHFSNEVAQLNAQLAAMHTRVKVVPIVHGCNAPVRYDYGGYEGQPYQLATGPATTLEVNEIGTRSPTMGPGPIRFTLSLNPALRRTRIIAVTRSGAFGWRFPDSGDETGWYVPEVIGPAPRCVGDAGVYEHG